MWSVQLAVSSFHDHVCLVLFQLSKVQKTCSSQHRHWSLQSRVPGCYLSGLYIFFTFTVVPYEQQTTTDSSSEDEKKKAFSLISVSTPLSPQFLQLVHNGLSHATH